jgi:hypothetical protein
VETKYNTFEILQVAGRIERNGSEFFRRGARLSGWRSRSTEGQQKGDKDCGEQRAYDNRPEALVVGNSAKLEGKAVAVGQADITKPFFGP